VDADEVADELHALPPKVTARSPGTNSPVTLPCVRHGRTTYDYWGCRCDVCTEAYNEHHRKLRAKRAAQRPEDNPLLWHGKVSTYKNHGYRCDGRIVLTIGLIRSSLCVVGLIISLVGYVTD
jgi:hypothetical protein